MEIKYNVDKLIKVRLDDFCESKFYRFIEPKEYFFGLIKAKSFIYCHISREVVLTLPFYYVIMDNKVMEKPRVTLYFQDNINEDFYFETYDDAKAFYHEITTSGVWVNKKSN